MDEVEQQAIRFSNMATRVAGGQDMSYLGNDLSDTTSIYYVRSLFERNRLRWESIVEHDVEQILAGNPPEYFLSERERANIYRSRRGIVVQNRVGELRKLSADSRAIDPYNDFLLEQQAKLESGIKCDYMKMGYACFVEQQYFYNTPEWHSCTAVLRFLSNHRCEICGKRNTELHVHHLTPVLTSYHYLFEYNFADVRLQVLCKDCHDNVHSNSIRATCGYYFITASKASGGSNE